MICSLTIRLFYLYSFVPFLPAIQSKATDPPACGVIPIYAYSLGTSGLQFLVSEVCSLLLLLASSMEEHFKAGQFGLVQTAPRISHYIPATQTESCGVVYTTQASVGYQQQMLPQVSNTTI